MPEDPKTLTDDDIETSERTVGRRRAVLKLGVGLAGSVALAMGCGGGSSNTTVAQGGTTDGDTGYRADPAGGGRGPTGATDSDAGECADPANYGVSGSGVTDSDGGNCADTAGNGRSGR